MDIGPSLHDLRTERNTYISNLQKNGTGGNDGLECVTMTSVENLTCVATLTSVVNIMLQRRPAENVTCTFPESVEHPYSQYSIRVSKAAQRQYLYWPNDALK